MGRAVGVVLCMGVVAAVALFGVSSVTALTVGGPGDARYFNHQLSDVLGVNWVKPARLGATIEFWFRLVDRHVATHSIFQGDECDYTFLETPERMAAGYWAPDDGFQLNIVNDRTRFTRGGDAAECVGRTAASQNGRQCLMSTNTTGWEHFAVTWNGTEGRVVMYRMGDVVYDVTAPTTHFKEILTARMALYYGQGSDEYVGGFKHAKALNGMIDEIRHWGYPRTQQQLRDNMWASLDFADPITGPFATQNNLNFYYRLDDTFYEPDLRVTSTSDASGNGNTGRLGWLPNSPQVLVYIDGTAAKGPTEPKRVASKAPLKAGTAPLKFFVPQSSAGAQATITIDLTAYDSSGTAVATDIATVAGLGDLAQVDGTPITSGGTIVTTPTDAIQQSWRVKYTPPTTGVGASFTDSFTYHVTLGPDSATQTVNIVALTVDTPADLSLKLNEAQGIANYMQLGGANSDGSPVQVVITTLPTRGKLYQAKFTGAGDGTYPTIVSDVTQLLPITVAGTVVTDHAGVVMFANDPNTFDATLYTTFQFAWRVTGAGADSASATVNIAVPQVNIPPSGVSGSAQLTEGINGADNVTIQLNYTDADEMYNANAHFFFTITDFPKLGVLWNLNDDGTLNSPISASHVQVPVVQTYVDAVLNCSTQYSYCTSLGCATARTMPWSPCVGPCPDHSYHCSNVAGPPLTYPTYGDSITAWCTAKENAGKQFVEATLPYPMYVSGVDVYENWSPGSVTRLQATSKYVTSNGGQDTEWQTLWSGSTQIVPPTYRVFSPPTCAFPVYARAVRMEFDSNVPGWQEFGAIQVRGTLQLPNGRVLNKFGRVQYVPPAGFSSASGGVFDSFAYMVNDCTSDSVGASTVQIAVPPPRDLALSSGGGIITQPVAGALDSVSYAQTVVVRLVPYTHQVVSLQLYVDQYRTQIANNFNRPDLLGTPLPSGTQWVQIRAFEDVDGKPVSMDGGVLTQGDGTTYVLGQNLTDSSAFTFLLYAPRLVTDDANDGSAMGTTRVGVWMTIGGVIIRIKLEFQLACTGGEIVIQPYGNCGGCRTAPEDQVAQLSEAERLYFESVCTSEFKRSTALSAVIYALAALSLTAIVGISAIVVINRAHSVIRAASFRFCMTMLFGAALVAVYVFLRSATKGAGCVALPWIAHIGFALTFSSLFAKTWRLRRIFLAKTLDKVPRMADSDLFKVVGAGVGLVVAYLIAWTAASRVSADVPTDTASRTYTDVCTSPEPIWSYVLLGLEGLAVAYGAKITYDVRDIPDDFNEARYIGSAIYGMTLSLVIALPVIFVASGSAPDTRVVVEQFAILLVNTMTVLLLFVPKISAVYGDDAANVSKWNATRLGKENNTTNPTHGGGGQREHYKTRISQNNQPSHEGAGRHTPGAVNGSTMPPTPQFAATLAVGQPSNAGAPPSPTRGAVGGVVAMNGAAHSGATSNPASGGGGGASGNPLSASPAWGSQPVMTRAVSNAHNPLSASPRAHHGPGAAAAVAVSATTGSSSVPMVQLKYAPHHAPGASVDTSATPGSDGVLSRQLGGPAGPSQPPASPRRAPLNSLMSTASQQ